ncbi:hypothetical protein BC624_10973 [Flavobacterium granuli]|uniref:Uncharacterized protein n=1 Tax=Flavobacterium granuli TaxID=280093 RepID=A0A1M5S5W5_9FLAO|nr:hypothetical protein BC624_10973 [Flavobacterium granuli]SHH33884.1 hypothetical protein SAMN05443373_11173 [Flavobacterium granuli]
MISSEHFFICVATDKSTLKKKDFVIFMILKTVAISKLFLWI